MVREWKGGETNRGVQGIRHSPTPLFTVVLPYKQVHSRGIPSTRGRRTDALARHSRDSE